jgi:CHAT domain-containing protein/tetratricopeptide (TPR) repeat protein
MIPKKVVLILTLASGLLFWGKLSGQCLPEKGLWNRILYLRDSSRVDVPGQIRELSAYLEKIASCPYSGDSTHALLLQRLGFLHVLNRDLGRGLALTRESIDLVYRNWNRPGINPAHVIKTFNNLQIIYDSLGRDYQRNQAIDSCIAVSLRLNTGFNYSLGLLYNKTEKLFKRGDYFNCILCADMMEEIERRNHFGPEYVLAFEIWKANSLIFTGNDSAAARAILPWIAACQGPLYEKYLGSLYGLLAVVEENQGNLPGAREYAGRAFSNYAKFHNPNGCASVLTNLGYNLYFKKLRQPGPALKYYFKALRYADSVESGNILDNIAVLFAAEGRFDSAFHYFREAFSFLGSGKGEEGILRRVRLADDNSVAEYLSATLLDKAAAHLQYYKIKKDGQELQQALVIYRLTDSLLDQLKAGQSVLQSKLFWRQDTRRLYEQAIEASFLADNAEEAFYFFEKSKAVLLNDEIQQNQWLNNREILKLAALKKQRMDLERGKPGPANPEVELYRLDREIEKIQQEVPGINPLYDHTAAGPGTLTIASVRKELLADHDAFVELFTGDSLVFVMVISRRQASLSRLPRNRFSELVSQYNGLIADPDRMNREYGKFLRASADLYALLFSTNPVPKGRIIISPDGEYFPFEALLVSKDPGRPDYFIREHAVSYAYSGRFLMNIFRNGASGGGFLGIAPGTFPYQSSLPALSGSGQSLERISGNFSGGENLLDGNASKSRFLQMFPRAGIIQLYTHASQNSPNSEPVIYLADSALYLSELIAGQRPATRLIVLSACETGNGRLFKGEGVYGFNRAFAAMNIPSSISNLWSVENESTYRLTELFYGELSKGLPLDLALQNAKLRFMTDSRQKDQLPYYWAAMVLVGRTEGIETGTTFLGRYKWPWAILVLVTLAILLALRRKSMPAAK